MTMATRRSDTERAIEQVLERVVKIEEELERLSKRMDDLENGHIAQGLYKQKTSSKA